MVGHDNVDRSVDNALDDGLVIRLCTKRWIHLKIGVVALLDVVLAQEHMVRGDFTGHLCTARFTGAHDVERTSSGEMLNMRVATGELADADIAVHMDFLALARPTGKPQTGGGNALVHLALADKPGILAVRGNRDAELHGVIHHRAHHARILDIATVIGDHNDAMAHHIAHLGQCLALAIFRTRARRMHVYEPSLGRRLLHKLDHIGIVGLGRGVGHAHDVGEAAICTCKRARVDVFLVLLPRFTQVNMAIHQSRNQDATRKVTHLATIRIEIRTHGGNSAVVGNLQVGGSVERYLRVDEAGAFKQ